MDPTTRETRALVERHWDALGRGDLAALLADYAEDAVLVTGTTGVTRGREAIGTLLCVFVTDILPSGSTRFVLEQTQVAGETGFIVWSAESGTHRIPYAGDTFIIRDGRIVVQTSAGQLLAK
jgi:uncharacterized protein (TIGR02246 family)